MDSVEALEIQNYAQMVLGTKARAWAEGEMGRGAEAPGPQHTPRGMLERVAASREGAETLYPA